MAVGSGSVAQLEAFVEDIEPGFPAYTDPSLQAYKAAGLKRSRLATLGPRAAAASLRAVAAGHRQARVQGDPWQQGGMVLVLPGGGVAWTWVDNYAGNVVQSERLLEALAASLEPS